MNELRILLSRLSWPSTSSRWWTIQELAGRLGDPDTRVETESALLKFFYSRKLEAEVVEVLCIFWMAVKDHEYSLCTELADNIPKPSLLSDLMTESCGLSTQPGQQDLQVAPNNFEIPEDFDGVQGVDLPRIFRNSLSRLEQHTGLPFVRQMAFEWAENKEAYPGVPYQGDSSHFSRQVGDGFIGQFSARAALRAISAYLRTLAVAQQYWGMPQEWANDYSLRALPVHPTLAFLKPCSPEWLPSCSDLDGENEVIDAACRAMLVRLDESRPGDELIAFSSPVYMSNEFCVELSLVRWAQASDKRIDDTELTGLQESFWKEPPVLHSNAPEPLSTTTFLVPSGADWLENNEHKARPLVGTLDFSRVGYLQHDLYPLRLFFPLLPSLQELKVTPCNGQLDITVEDQVIADFTYWNAGWGPARPRQFGGNCGAALISNGKSYREGDKALDEPRREFYLWQVRTLYRNNDFSELSERLQTGVFYV